jgi:hypothetical protein
MADRPIGRGEQVGRWPVFGASTFPKAYIPQVLIIEFATHHHGHSLTASKRGNGVDGVDGVDGVGGVG